MRGGIIRGAGLCAVAACCIVPSLGEGAAKRGGNHGCSEAEGSIFSDHWFEPGDNISFGYQFVPASGLPGSSDRDNFYAQNVSSDGGTPSSLSCGADPGLITVVESNLGPGDDSVRLDGKGIPPDGDGDFGPIPKAVESSLKGGAGGDTIRGHKGPDFISGGSGGDVIKADDGKEDIVKCGSGNDKADVDSRDDVSGCEKTT